MTGFHPNVEKTFAVVASSVESPEESHCSTENSLQKILQFIENLHNKLQNFSLAELYHSW